MIWWTERWNPIGGCTKCSPACANCYAEKDHTKRHKAYLAGKLQNMPCYSTPFDQVRFFPERLDAPLHWRKTRRIFAVNMGDLFHEDVPDAWLDRIFAVMAPCPQHTFMVLTKRWERMAEYLGSGMHQKVMMARHERGLPHHLLGHITEVDDGSTWPLPNVLHGATVWNQASMDEAAKHLLKMPAGARLFLSVEPMLGPVVIPAELLARLSWLVCGGETGPGARPMHPDWPRSLRDQCQAASVPFFFKQWGEWAPKADTLEVYLNEPCATAIHLEVLGGDCRRYDIEKEMIRVGKARAGCVLDGRTWEEVPNA